MISSISNRTPTSFHLVIIDHIFHPILALPCAVNKDYIAVIVFPSSTCTHTTKNKLIFFYLKIFYFYELKTCNASHVAGVFSRASHALLFYSYSVLFIVCRATNLPRTSFRLLLSPVCRSLGERETN